MGEGLQRTVVYHGNRIDIGGHRFFSKSDRVMEWWAHILPVYSAPGESTAEITYRNQQQTIPVTSVGDANNVMLVRPRQSRIYYLRKFFTYPVNLSWQTLHNLGVVRIVKILASYTKARLRPRKPEKNLEDFFINRFGVELYRTFFKDYTEKVWGVPCTQISAEWGSQRVKGVSITKALLHALKSLKPKHSSSIAQKDTETSLIERFLYPKFGPGQMWEEVAKQVKEKGGEIHLGKQVTEIRVEENKVVGVTVEDVQTKQQEFYTGDYVISTMPVKELVAGLTGISVPEPVKKIAHDLQYRDFMTVGLLVTKLLVAESGTTTIPDTWIYVQEADVKVGRLQIFNNWSPFLVEDPTKVWIGMEYFVQEGDNLWSMEDQDFVRFASNELEKLGFITQADVLDGVVIRMKKTYPSYVGAYEHFNEVQAFLDPIPNLYLIGRNGMHKYNNQDHSMLTAMTVVDNIIANRADKANIWAVNTEEDYHEEK
jgi:protoporphyrinogen oxidase